MPRRKGAGAHWAVVKGISFSSLHTAAARGGEESLPTVPLSVLVLVGVNWLGIILGWGTVRWGRGQLQSVGEETWGFNMETENWKGETERAWLGKHVTTRPSHMSCLSHCPAGNGVNNTQNGKCLPCSQFLPPASSPLPL